MRKRKILGLVNIIISGFAAYMITMFFASGAIGENYTDKTFVAPEFFITLGVWGVAAIFASIQIFKDSLPLFVISLIITWVSIPIGIKVGLSVATSC